MSAHQEAMKTLDDLEALGHKRKAKLDLLTKHKDNPVLQQIFLNAYDWERTFGIRVPFFTADKSAGGHSMKPLFGSAAHDTTPPWEAFTALLDLLVNRKSTGLTGNAAREAWDLLALRLTNKERQWYSRVLNRDLKIEMTGSTVELLWPGLIKSFGVQLAKSMGDIEVFEPTEREPWLGWPVVLEPKLDGMRVTVQYNHDLQTCTGFSREGHILPNIQDLLDPLAAYLSAAYGKSCWIDSEAFADVGLTGGFNSTLSLVKREDVDPADRAKLKFHCFDMVQDVAGDKRPLSARHKALALVLGVPSVGDMMVPPNFILLKRKIAHTMDELMAYYNEMLDEGYEGVMVKFNSAPYRAKRTSAWLKLKPTASVDAKITGFELGKKASRHEKVLGAFVVVRADTGETCNVGGGLSDMQRKEFWARRDSLLGQMLEFKEEKRSGATTKANFPRFIRMRPDREKL